MSITCLEAVKLALLPGQAEKRDQEENTRFAGKIDKPERFFIPDEISTYRGCFYLGVIVATISSLTIFLAHHNIRRGLPVDSRIYIVYGMAPIGIVMTAISSINLCFLTSRYHSLVNQG